MPDGKPPISGRMGLVSFTVFLFSCTLLSSVTTATWDPLAVHVDADVNRHCRVS